MRGRGVDCVHASLDVCYGSKAGTSAAASPAPLADQRLASDAGDGRDVYETPGDSRLGL